MAIDWRTLPGGKDFSHWNGAIDWAREAAEAPAFVILKATDGMGVDPMFDRNRKGAEQYGLRWLPYPFLEPGDGEAAIRHFVSLIGDKSIPAALDWEKAGVSSGVVEGWIDILESEMRAGLGYYGIYPPDRMTARIASWPRWLPQYPGSDTAPPRLPIWDGKPVSDWSKTWLIWQWSEKGRDPAAPASAVDLDRLACPVDVFDHWYRTGELTPFAAGPGDDEPAEAVVMPLPARGGVLRLNMTGDDVLALQRRLVALGAGIGTDAAYGPQTRTAVRLFQQQHGLVADGVAGPATLAALNAAA